MIGITNAGGRPVNAAQLRLFCQPSTPTNPRNGDIFVVTSVPCPGCEIVTYNIQPGRVDQAENGYVFININGGGNIHQYGAWLPLTKNPIIALSAVFTSVLQKINGTYKMVTAYIYINGWHQISAAAPLWDGTLWGPNNQHTDHTGGWGYASSNANVPYFGEFIRWSCDNTTIFLYTNGAVDVTNFSRLRYDGQMWGETSFGLSNKNGWLDGSNWVARVTGNGTVYNGSVDISGISGSFYITAYASSEGGSGAQFNRIWLE